MPKSPIKNYVETGAQFTEMTRQQAEALVKRLVKSGDLRRRDTEHMVQTVLSRGRETTDRLSTLVQTEVAKQLKALSERFEDVEGRLESLATSIRGGIIGTAGTGETSAPQPAASTSSVSDTSTTAAPEKPKAKKSTAKKSGAKKSGAKKKSAKKSGAKKTGAKKSAAKRSASGAVGSSGVRKVSTTRQAPASE